MFPSESLWGVVLGLGTGDTEGVAPVGIIGSFGVGGAPSISVGQVIEFFIVVADLLHDYK